MTNQKKSWLNLLFLIMVLFVNYLGATGFINNLSQKDISDKYQTLITPAGFTFSIWGLIYLLLFVSLILMIIRKNINYYNLALENISKLFWISCILNILWIILFSYDKIVFSVLLIFIFLLSLTKICQKLLSINDSKHYLLALSFGIYTGWVFIATVVNIAAALVKLNWNGFGINDEIWVIIVSIIALFLLIFLSYKLKNVAINFSVAWAFWGILNSPNSTDLIKKICIFSIIIILINSIINFYKNGFKLIGNQK